VAQPTRSLSQSEPLGSHGKRAVNVCFRDHDAGLNEKVVRSESTLSIAKFKINHAVKATI
jgi:hypothetical protein